MSEWKEYKLKDISINNKGNYGIPASAVEYSEDKYTYLRISDINDDGSLNKGNLKSVEDKNASNYLLAPNDIVFARTGNSTGRSYFYNKKDGKLVYAGFLIKFSIDETKINPKILKYYTHSQPYYDWVRAVDNGATRGNINAQTYGEMEISLPPRLIQDTIVSILSSLDDKIDLLHRQNQTLEQMAETLFCQWFIEEADDSWKEVKLSEVTNIGIGRTPPRKEFHWFSSNSKDVKWISIKDLGNSGLFIFDTSEYLKQNAVKEFNIPIIPQNTVVLSFKMTVGRVGITADNMLSNEAIAHFKFNNKTPFCKEYLFFFLKKYPYQILGSTSSIVTSINTRMIKDLNITIPDNKRLVTFESLVKDYFDKIRSNQKQIRTLEKLRDTLLPKLMSGEVRVKI